VNTVARAAAAFDSTIDAARRRWRVFDHFWRARERYAELLGGRLAAAIAYYGFFAVFALALVAYSIFGFLLDHNLDLLSRVDDFLSGNLPFIDPTTIRDSRTEVGIVGLVGLVFTGIGWVEAIRSSQRLIWDLPQQPGNMVVRRLVDLAVLVGIFLLVALSAAAIDTVEWLLEWIAGGPSVLLTVVSWGLSGAVNMVLATALLAAVPRLRMSPRRLLPSVVFVGLGILLLNTVGRWFVARWQDNPAYAVVASGVGLLVYLYLFNQLLIFGAAVAATGATGRVVDLAAGSPRERPDSAAPGTP
jgi:membrane protein